MRVKRCQILHIDTIIYSVLLFVRSMSRAGLTTMPNKPWLSARPSRQKIVKFGYLAMSISGEE